MPEIKIRKMVVSVEETWHEGGPVAETPLRKAACLAVIENPYAGRYEENIAEFMDDLKPLGVEMAGKLIDALGGNADDIQGYGKGAIVGEAGEIEHGALWHVPGGYSMRESIEESMAIVPSTKKVGAPGTRLDIPLTHTNASYVRSHFDAMEVGVNDAPRANEMIVALVMSTGARVHNRAGGLAAAEVKGEDGLR
jgi:hypothetical protein